MQSGVNTAGEFGETIRVALYAQAGIGKTLQIKRLVEVFGADRVIVVSAEHGLNTVRSCLRTENVITCGDMADVRRAWGIVKARFNTPDYWVCIDGGSQIAEWIENEQFIGADRYFELLSKGETPSGMPDNLRMFGRFVTKKGDDITIDNRSIYRIIGSEIQNLLSAWIKLDCNLYANYLAKMTESDASGKRMIPWGPDVPGNVGVKKIQSAFDFMGRLTIDDAGKLCASFKPSRMAMAKSREERDIVGVIADPIVEFELGKFVQQLRGR